MTDAVGDRLRVLHLIEGLGSGGAEKLLYTNLKHFDTSRVESLVVTVFSKQDYWRNPIADLGVNVVTLDCPSRRSIIRGVFRLIKILRDFKPDVIHTHLFTANIIGRLAGRVARIPVISSVHSLDYEPEALTDATQNISRKMLLSRLLDKWTAKLGCRMMIAVSKRAKESTHSRLGFPIEKIHVIYNPVDICMSETGQNDESGRNSVDRDRGQANLLIVGRVAPEKGLQYAIAAMPEILREFPHAKLRIVGAQANKAYLTSVLAEIDRQGVREAVELLGEQRNIVEHLSRCDVFLFPTLFEGLGIALVEAMASKRACVASDIRPLSEFMTNGVNGILVESRNSNLIGEAVLGLLNDAGLRERLGAAAKETVQKMFMPQPAADKLVDLFSLAVATKSSRRICGIFLSSR